jgi:hypothetical protein
MSKKLKLTDKECFDVMVEWGGEKTIIMMKEMVHFVGTDKCAQNIIETMENAGKHLTEEFKQFIKRGAVYLSQQIQNQ